MPINVHAVKKKNTGPKIVLRNHLLAGGTKILPLPPYGRFALKLIGTIQVPSATKGLPVKIIPSATCSCKEPCSRPRPGVEGICTYLQLHHILPSSQINLGLCLDTVDTSIT